MHTAQPTLAAIAQSIIAEHGDTIQATDWSGGLKAWQAEVDSRQTFRSRMQRLFGHRDSGQDDCARATGKRTLAMMKEAAKHLKIDIELLASAAEGLGLAMSGIPGSTRPTTVLTPQYLADDKDLRRLARLSVKDMYFLNTPVDKPLQAERIVMNREGRRCRILGTCYEELERQGVRLELKKGIVRCTQQWFEKVEKRKCGGTRYQIRKDAVAEETGKSS